MYHFKRFFCLVLALSTLVGCGGTDPAGSIQSTDSSVQEFGTEAVEIFQAETMEVYQKQALTARSDITHLFSDGDNIFFSTEQEIYRLEGTSETLVCSADAPITCFTVSGDNILYVAGSGESSENGYQENYALIRDDGTSQTSFPLTNIPDYPGAGAENILISAAGEIYLQLVDCIAVLDENGSLLRQITGETELALSSLVQSHSGEIYGANSYGNTEIYAVSDSGITLYLTLHSGGFSDGVMFPGGDTADFQLVSSNGLYACSASTITQTAKWADSGLSFLNITEIYPLSDGSLVLLDSGTLYQLCKSTEEEVTPSQVIRIAVDMTQTQLEEAVARFNAVNPAYHVELVQYFNGNDGYEQGMDQLKLELASGEGPDIIGITCYSMDLSTIEAYGNHGYLVDLNTFLSADTEAKEDLAILSALKNNDKLYYVTDGYSINTVLGLTSKWQNRTGWTLEEYESLMNENGGTVFRYMSPLSFLSYSFNALREQFVDSETATCSFDSDEFIHLLELSARHENTQELRKEDDAAGIIEESYFLTTGQATASNLSLWSISQFATLENQAGQELSLIGWPNYDGSCGSSITPNHLFAINANSQNQEGAWEFLKFVMTDEQLQLMVAENRRFPVSNKALETAAAMEMSGTLLPGMGYDAASEAQVAKVLALIHEIPKVTNWDSIFDIITEETEAFFAGDKTAADTASIIQSRVQIYLSEQS